MNVRKACERRAAGAWALSDLHDPLALDLSRAVAESVDLQDATYTVFVADTVDTSGLLDFRSGGQTDPSPAPDAMLAEALKASVEPSFVVFEDWMSRPNDPFLKSSAMPFRVWNKEVYQLFATTDAGSHPAWARACANYSPLFHGFVFAGAAPEVFEPRRTVAEFKLTGIIFGIFDGESYMIAHV